MRLSVCELRLPITEVRGMPPILLAPLAAAGMPCRACPTLNLSSRIHPAPVPCSAKFAMLALIFPVQLLENVRICCLIWRRARIGLERECPSSLRPPRHRQQAVAIPTTKGRDVLFSRVCRSLECVASCRVADAAPTQAGQRTRLRYFAQLPFMPVPCQNTCIRVSAVASSVPTLAPGCGPTSYASGVVMSLSS